MTELQWLIKMLTQHKLPKAMKDLFIERLGEVEASLARPQPMVHRPSVGVPGISAQAPSTQRLLEEQGIPMPVGPIKTPQGVVDKETGTIRVPTGNGTSGPRKW